jgi:hypothetical protein
MWNFAMCDKLILKFIFKLYLDFSKFYTLKMKGIHIQ